MDIWSLSSHWPDQTSKQVVLISTNPHRALKSKTSPEDLSRRELNPSIDKLQTPNHAHSN
ncbi:uncharacterized protein CLUP02_11489 [Colletotrichum lupini]|uniref:Uncharacterized protein n=1 Tax=Colletotrichum lupini TaxID=145971 RepID=A0A9Q8SZH9_9PEZI|nr:uncharacterized protein CLUP02_11489 [Colletotrichum lupini]UQC85990.1 hypothetical protein CLUP02_11489 [Colletotrichum lupini]